MGSIRIHAIELDRSKSRLFVFLSQF